MGIVGQVIGTVVGYLLGGLQGALIGNCVGFFAMSIPSILFGIVYAMAQDPEIGDGKGWRRKP